MPDDRCSYCKHVYIELWSASFERPPWVEPIFIGPAPSDEYEDLCTDCAADVGRYIFYCDGCGGWIDDEPTHTDEDGDRYCDECWEPRPTKRQAADVGELLMTATVLMAAASK